jgi:hypothetical protein
MTAPSEQQRYADELDDIADLIDAYLDAAEADLQSAEGYLRVKLRDAALSLRFRAKQMERLEIANLAGLR